MFRNIKHPVIYGVCCAVLVVLPSVQVLKGFMDELAAQREQDMMIAARAAVRQHLAEEHGK